MTIDEAMDYAKGVPKAYQSVAANDAVVTLAAEVERLRAENKTLCRIEKGEVWYYGDDGNDYPESLGCPVIMEPGVLRRLLADNERLRGENERLKKKIKHCETKYTSKCATYAGSIFCMMFLMRKAAASDD